VQVRICISPETNKRPQHDHAAGASPISAFFGINNSGASNLALGSNDVAEVNVISNAYSAQYGQYAGSQVSYKFTPSMVKRLEIVGMPTAAKLP
jgi:hypothetical protein